MKRLCLSYLACSSRFQTFYTKQKTLRYFDFFFCDTKQKCKKKIFFQFVENQRKNLLEDVTIKGSRDREPYLNKNCAWIWQQSSKYFHPWSLGILTNSLLYTFSSPICRTKTTIFCPHSVTKLSLFLFCGSCKLSGISAASRYSWIYDSLGVVRTVYINYACLY